MAFMLVSAWACPLASANENATGAEPLVRVNRYVITRTDFDLACLVRGIEESQRPGIQRRLLERLVEERLMADFLASRRVKASASALDAQVEQIYSLLQRLGKEPNQFLEELGINETLLRETLSLPLAWKAYMSTVVPDQKLREEYEAHRRELDGTKLQARHIVIKVAPDAAEEAWIDAEHRIEKVREQIASDETTFADAAKQFSEGPSADAGGDVGFFPFRGIMSAPFADVAFALKTGELSPVVRTAAGVHLIEVTDEQPGQLSLEDVRPAVFERISQRMWDQQVAELRSRAKVEWIE